VKDIALFLACLVLMAGIAAVTYAARTGRRT
jgi:hypothetical protein